MNLERCFRDDRNEKGIRGAAMLEFSFIILSFFGLILTFIDVAHYTMATTVLNRSAQQALDLAVTLKALQKDFYNQTAVASSADYQAYVAARNEVIAKAVELPLRTVFGAPGATSALTLTSFTIVDEGINNQAISVPNMRAAVIRPGESWRSSLYDGFLNHPGICSKSQNSACPVGRSSTDEMATMLKFQPIVIALQARKRSFIPFVGTIPITVEVVGWTQQYPTSDYDLSNYLPPSATPTPQTCADRGFNQGSCTNWDDFSCTCCDNPGNCPSGQHWDIEMCRCTNCPYPASACPSGMHYWGWTCMCGCDDGTHCSTNDPSMRYPAEANYCTTGCIPDTNGGGLLN